MLPGLEEVDLFMSSRSQSDAKRLLVALPMGGGRVGLHREADIGTEKLKRWCTDFSFSLWIVVLADLPFQERTEAV